MLALRGGRRLRYPDWQFDLAGPKRVLDGLVEVLHEIDTDPLDQAAWLLHAEPQLQGRSPLDALRQGKADLVVAIAAEYGAV